MNTTYKSNNNVVYSCKYHVVWCPKYIRKVLVNGVDVRLKELLTEYAANLSVDILEMEIMPDHVHMLLEVDPEFNSFLHYPILSFCLCDVFWFSIYCFTASIGAPPTVDTK